MPMLQIQRKMQELFHSVENDINLTSFIKLCLEGHLQFLHLWDREDLTLNASINEENETGQTLCLKRSISQIKTGQFTSKLLFTCQSLCWATKNGPTIKTAQTLLILSNKAIANLKKANAHALNLIGPDRQLPTGKTEEDLDNYVLENMFSNLDLHTNIGQSGSWR
jgi:hypothetical protein